MGKMPPALAKYWATKRAGGSTATKKSKKAPKKG